MPHALDTRGRRLRAALAAVLVNAPAPELPSYTAGSTRGPASAWWSLVWRARAGTCRSPADGDDHRRATFYVTGMAHSITGGSAWETTPCRAVQQAG